MASSRRQPIIHPRVLELLGQLRQMVRRYIVTDYLCIVLLIVGSAFWIGLLLDYGPILVGGLEMPRSARALLLIALGVGLLVTTVKLLFGRLSRRLPDESLALLLERQHPELGERLMTSVQLAAHRDVEDDDYAPKLFEHVRSEAAYLAEEVELKRVFLWKPLICKAVASAALILAILTFAIVYPDAARQAFARLLLVTDEPWPRRSQLEMVGVEVPIVSFAEPNESAPPEIRLLQFEDNELRLPRGGSATLRVRALADGAVVPELCTVQYRMESGSRGQANMRRVGRPRDGYQYFSLDGPPLDGLTEDVSLVIRGLDDRLPTYRVVAVEPPSVTQLQIQCRYPEYLRDPGSTTETDLEVDYAPGLRIREGSNLVITGRSSKPLSEVSAVIKGMETVAEPVSAEVGEDRMSFTVRLSDMRDDQTLMVLPVDDYSISAGSPFRYFLGVVKDQPPEVQLQLIGIGSAITPNAKIPFRGQATDDYELSRTEVGLAAISQDNGEPVLRNVTPDRDGEFDSEVDLRTLASDKVMASLRPGERLSFYAEASDRYDLGAKHVSQSDLFGLDVVSPEELLGRLERRELALRGRLEQSIDEIRQLREVLDRIAVDSWEEDPEASSATTAFIQEPDEAARKVQLRTLRIQQASLQAAKTGDEILGISSALGDIILEMENNRVDSVDRRDRIKLQVKEPLEEVLAGEMKELRQQIDVLQSKSKDVINGPEEAALAVDRAEAVLLRLTAILESMLDLESYNEILDMVRDLIRRQESLIEDTKDEQQKSLLDLFK